MGLKRNLIGKAYPSQDYGVTEEAIKRYALAYNDDNPWFFDTRKSEGVVAPPMFGVVIGWMPILLVMTDTELQTDRLRILHREHDMYFYRTVAPRDIVTSTAKILSIEARETEEFLVVEVFSATQKKEPVQRMLFTGVIREGGRKERGSEDNDSQTFVEDPLFRTSQLIDADQTYRYAQASGDHNPIHTDENVAKMAGFPSIIVHELCTMAFTSKVMIDNLCAGDPRRLKRLCARFSRPTFPGQPITTAVWSLPDRCGVKRYAYETENSEGQAVIKGGIAEIASV